MLESLLKQKIRTGETVVGVGGILASTNREVFERVLERGPYDFVWVDTQHAPYSEPDLYELCGIAEDFKIPLFLRIMDTRQTWLIGKYLDLGLSGIEVPQVNRMAEARKAVENFYYPPLGIRSYGGRFRLSRKDGEDPLEYARWWNEYGVLWLQMESAQAVTSAYALARSGVDCLSFGPADLMIDLHYHPHPRLKTVDDCVRFVVEATAGTDTKVLYRNGTPERRQKYIDMGVTVLLDNAIF